MDIRDVKKNLNRRVWHKSRESEGEYILNACIIRRHKRTGQFYYQAELADVKNGGWLVYCGLNEIEEVNDG